jgi:hypothetical protein
MKVSRRALGAALVGAVAVVAFTIGQVCAKPVPPPAGGAPRKELPDGAAAELAAMCAYCDDKADGGDRCTDAGAYALGAPGCSYPPCVGLMKLADGGSPLPEEKLACAACRAMCPFSSRK